MKTMTLSERMTLANEIVVEAQRTWRGGFFARAVDGDDVVIWAADRPCGLPAARTRIFMSERGIRFGASNHHALNHMAAQAADHALTQAEVKSLRNRGMMLAWDGSEVQS